MSKIMRNFLYTVSTAEPCIHDDLEVIVHGGVQRRGVAVPRKASISDGERHGVVGIGRAVVSL